MNGIKVEKKRLTAEQKHLIKTFISEKFKGKTMLQGYIWFAKKCDVSVSSLQNALSKKKENDFLSEQIIDKIIKAL